MLPELEGYETLHKVGEGGVGAVYVARERGGAGRLFALKFLHAHTALRAADLHRFLREGRLGQRLHHPHVLPVNAVHESGHGPVLVMEYVEGQTLASMRGKDGLAERLVILASIADALEHLHRNGVVHRDVKPANVLVREDGHPFLIDFGFARTLAVDSTITASGTLLGTPAFLAPELLRGNAGGDFRSDVYAFGVTLFEVTSGRLPFAGDSLPALFEHILFEEPPALATEAPRGLDVIVRRCLEKRPADRYPSAAAVRDDLRRVVAGMPPRGGGASLWFKRELRRLRRERLRVAVGSAALLLALVVGLVFVLRGTSGRLAERELADDVAAALVHLDRGELETAMAQLLALERREPRASAPVLARADAYAEFELWNRASEEVERARTLGYATATAARTPVELYHGAIVDFVARRYREADAALERALAQEPELYRAHFLLYLLRFQQGRRDEARHALEECRRNLKEVNPRHAVVSSFLARLDGRYEDSIAILTSLRERLGTEVPAWMRRRLGEAYLVANLEGERDPKHLAAAMEELTLATELEPGDGAAWCNLGNARFLVGDLDAARAAGERALSADPRLPGAHRLLAALDARAQDWSSAERHLELAGDAAVALLQLPVLRAELAYQMGRKLYVEGRYAEGIRELERCLAADPEHLAAHCLLAQSATLVEDGRLGFDEAAAALARIERWKPRFVEGILPGESDGLAFQQGRSPDVHIALVSSAGRLGDGLTKGELDLVGASLAWLRTHVADGALADASALNLACAVARAPGGLNDCEWAYELLETRDLRTKFEGTPAGRQSLRAIELACP